MLAPWSYHWVRHDTTVPPSQLLKLPSVPSPLLGGTFSNPATKWPGLFDTELFRNYPYLLPSLLAASLAFCGAVFGFFALEEVCSHACHVRLRTNAAMPDPTKQASKTCRLVAIVSN